MVKRTLTQASLEQPTSNQILLMEAVYEFCRNEITSVNFFLIEKNPLQSVREFLQRRYAVASTVPGNAIILSFFVSCSRSSSVETSLA